MRQQPGAQATVGDTVWVSRAVAVPDGYAVRPNGWALTGAVELLGQPTVERTGDSVVVRYPLVAWDPGPHTVQMPGPILIAPSGAEDTLPARAVTFSIKSVLPAGVPDSAIQIQPGVGTIVRGEASLWPLLAAVLLATGVVLLLRWWHARTGKRRKIAEPALPTADVALEAWHLAGEDRAVVAFAARGLRDGIARNCAAAAPQLPTPQLLEVLARERPQWPLADLTGLLSELDLARFSASATDSVDLARRAEQLGERLARAAT